MEGLDALGGEIWTSDEVSQLSADEQFRWVCGWLSEKKLFGTLDSLMTEYDLENASTRKLEVRPVDPISKEKVTYNEAHKRSVLSVCCHPTKPWIFSTDTDKRLVITHSETGCVLSGDRTNNPFQGSIISIDCHPTVDALLIGTMDERHAILTLHELPETEFVIQVQQQWHAHEKYVVRAKWSPNGLMFATASHDRSVGVYNFDPETLESTLLKKLVFPGTVESICWTKNKSLVVAVRDTVFLYYVNVETWEQTLVNMNALGDTHVSFNPLELVLSPCEKHLLVCTDTSRAILFKTGTDLQARVFFGAKNDGMSQPRAAFDKNDLLYLTSQDTNIYVYDTSNDSLLTTLVGHKKLVRDIKYDARTDTLVTVSYDATIKLWER